MLFTRIGVWSKIEGNKQKGGVLLKERLRGIAVCNPVDLNREHMLFTAEYAVRNKINHYQIVGPIHNPEKGNIDGMTLYGKYSRFNNEKNIEYVRFCERVVNEVCDILSAAEVKTYMWHHELEVPEGFCEAYPEIMNDSGEAEITHPVIRDFLENKILDFFRAYPKIDGIILTLHETRIPILKLTNQKLSKVERVKYVTEILYEACKRLGKELIVRPFASIDEDYELMAAAYEQISRDMVIMDKWTQFDWSLTLPENRFFNKIKHNPLLVETDIFGEYFGLGKIPIMLKEHIKKNYTYSDSFSPAGFVSRIDRAGLHSFGDVNEINYRVMLAYEKGLDVDTEISAFFRERFGSAGDTVRRIMENTEDIQRRIFYIDNYYFTEGSRFPRINHSKNHFYFELMREKHSLQSGEWFIPKNWDICGKEALRAEKKSAVDDCAECLKRLEAARGELGADDYRVLEEKFLNLYYCALAWQQLLEAFISYAGHFECMAENCERALFESFEKLRKINIEGKARLGESYYINFLGTDQLQSKAVDIEPIEAFIRDVKASFEAEKAAMAGLSDEGLYDFVICGGGCEGHGLKKEVNFSDTDIRADGICRIPGTLREGFSAVNTHGWFSYELRVRPNAENTVTVAASGTDGVTDFKLTVGERQYEVHERGDGKREFSFVYAEDEGRESVRIRIDRISGYTPFIYEIKIR